MSILGAVKEASLLVEGNPAAGFLRFPKKRLAVFREATAT